MSEHLNSDLSEQESTPSAMESPGSILQAARERLGLSQESIADQLNLTVDKVNALETDRYDKLVSDVFALGYLRRYSKNVDLDEDEMAERFRQWQAATQPPSAAPPRRPVSPRLSLGLVVVILLVGLVSAFVFFGGRGEAPPEQAPTGGAQDSHAQEVREPEPLSGDMSLWQDNEAQAQVTDHDYAPLPIEQEEVQPEQEIAPELSPVTEQTTPAASEPRPTVAAADAAEEAASDQLSFTFTDECWVEVRDADDRVLRAEVANAGQWINLEGQAPFSVMLGNARAASVYYNGQPVTLPTRQGARTARITIGP